jgi:dipeptidyl-peptidase 4
MGQELDAAVYRGAEQMLAHNRATLVDAANLTPRWLDGGARFWYRADGPRGQRFVLVDPAARSRTPAFDHERLADALGDACGAPVDATRLPFRTIDLRDGGVEFDAFDRRWRCVLDSYACETREDHVPRDRAEVRSPDDTKAVLRRGYDLVVRSVETGEERALTSNGVADRAYGIQPDCSKPAVLARRLGLAQLPPMVAWSPDSRRLLTHRTDQRGVALAHLVEAAPPGGGRPVLHTYRYPLPGDEALPRAELVVLDVEAGTAVWADAEPLLMPSFSPLMRGKVWWGEDGAAIYYLEQPRDLRTLRLRRLDPVTGEVRTVIEERGETRVESGQYLGRPPIVRVLSGGREVLWYSQRDGWGHLYLYDAESGEPRAQVTSGEWAVQQILHVDEAERAVYFLAAGMVAQDPYRRQVCRAALDGSGVTRLDDDELDHAVTVPPNEAYFVDAASTTDTPSVITVRGWDGRVPVELERTDISCLLDAGWTPPEHFRATAADGVTDIYGLLYRPRGFDPSKRYPVVDHPYPGPQKTRVVPTFGQEPGYANAEALAALGFVVVAIDGRGTPGRSKAFHDLGRIGDAGYLEDHVAALRQLAERRPWMDLERVGIFGLSGGGYATVRAMCAFPDVYKVGVAEAGNHDQRCYQAGWGETYDGPLDPEVYVRSSNIELADRLQGRLLLIHGEMDDNVHPHLTTRLVDRLIAADKDFEMLLVPGAEHLFVGYEHYVNRRLWDFLVRHLLGQEPPAGYRLRPVPIDLESYADRLGG